MPFSAIFNFQPAHIWCCSEFRRCRLQNLESQDHFSPHRAFKKSKTQTRGLQNHDFIKVVQIDGYWHSEFLVFIKCLGMWPALSYVEFASKEWHFKCLPTYFIPSTLFTWSWSNFHISIKMCCVSSMQKMLQKSWEQEIIQLGPVYGSTDVQQPEKIVQLGPINRITDVLEKHFTHT